MRVAVLADVHANLPALEAVLAEPDVERADAIVLLGDIALGPLPEETLDRLSQLGEKAVWVHGNCERELVVAYDGAGEGPPPSAMAADTAPLLRRDHRDRLSGLPMTVTLDVDGVGPALFFHASPRRDNEFLMVDSSVDFWRSALAGVREQLLVCGHTHMPFDRLVDGRRVVNPGSVGMAYGPPGAYWCLLGPHVELRRTPYDAIAAAARIRAGSHPQADTWAQEYVLEPHSDAEALEAFTALAQGAL
jgi:predicted phosphodiesterase